MRTPFPGAGRAALAFVACLAVAPTPSAAQTGPGGIDAAAADRYGCFGDLSSPLDMRCCLARLDRNVLNDPALTPDERGAARRFEASLVAALAAMGEPEEPRYCPTPTSYPPIIIRPPTSRPIFGNTVGPPRGGAGQPVAVGAAGSYPRVAVAFGFGTLLQEFDTDVPAGGGVTQRFPALPGGQIDARLIWLFSLALTAEDPEFRRATTGPLLGLFVGYTWLRSHVDKVINLGGATNTAFEGEATLSRPHVGAGLSLPLNRGQAVGSMPPLALHLGATLGYSTLTLRDSAGPFRDTREGWDASAELGLDVRLDERWTLRPGVEAIFDPAGGGGDTITRFKIGLRHEF